MNAIEEMGQDARKGYEWLRDIFHESGRETSQILSKVLNKDDVQKGQIGTPAAAPI